MGRGSPGRHETIKVPASSYCTNVSLYMCRLSGSTVRSLYNTVSTVQSLQYRSLQARARRRARRHRAQTAGTPPGTARPAAARAGRCPPSWGTSGGSCRACPSRTYPCSRSLIYLFMGFVWLPFLFLFLGSVLFCVFCVFVCFCMCIS